MQEPKNVDEALALIMSELPAIGKDSKAAPGQGGYSYRGIEAITAHLQFLLGKYKVDFKPRVDSWERDQVTVAGKPWTDDRLLVTYEISHGPTETSTYVTVPGVGRDNSDKGTNKAMTQALKYAYLQVFCIGDSKSDADGTTHETDHTPKVDYVAPFIALQKKLGLERKAIGDAVTVATNDRTRDPRDCTDDERNQALKIMEAYAQVAEDKAHEAGQAVGAAVAEALAKADV